jgi:ribosomal protein L32E
MKPDFLRKEVARKKNISPPWQQQKSLMNGASIKLAGQKNVE